ncbi:zf-TFIIB domain-containing protein [Alloacidobacterium dinghuense]|uniref:Zf-TFIIB domain-containing protein n=1 Tax=Alloacidobacterium dinghuense TaxID=2763107 RepID=A0A7G8BGF3_9BACT|nr:zf-TFIIB domain-containing protein [Alloacidobacterium dinghuense]
MTFTRVTLKVCEGCGGLWFRAQELNEVYCATCSTRLRAFPAPRSRRLAGRPRKNRRITTQHAAAGREL